MVLQDIDEQVKKCNACDLCKTRINTVFGTGNPHADIMFVGEAPGRNEDETGIPFVGAAGHLLDDYLKAVGLSRDDVDALFVKADRNSSKPTSTLLFYMIAQVSASDRRKAHLFPTAVDDVPHAGFGRHRNGGQRDLRLRFACECLSVYERQYAPLKRLTRR